MKARLELTCLLKLPTVLVKAQLTYVIIRKNICNIPKGIVLTLKIIRGDNVTFDKKSLQYQNYLIYRQHKSFKVKQKFSEFRNNTRAEARINRTRKG